MAMGDFVSDKDAAQMDDKAKREARRKAAIAEARKKKRAGSHLTGRTEFEERARGGKVKTSKGTLVPPPKAKQKYEKIKMKAIEIPTSSRAKYKSMKKKGNIMSDLKKVKPGSDDPSGKKWTDAVDDFYKKPRRSER